MTLIMNVGTGMVRQNKASHSSNKSGLLAHKSHNLSGNVFKLLIFCHIYLIVLARTITTDKSTQNGPCLLNRKAPQT